MNNWLIFLALVVTSPLVFAAGGHTQQEIQDIYNSLPDASPEDLVSNQGWNCTFYDGQAEQTAQLSTLSFEQIQTVRATGQTNHPSYIWKKASRSIPGLNNKCILIKEEASQSVSPLFHVCSPSSRPKKRKELSEFLDQEIVNASLKRERTGNIQKIQDPLKRIAQTKVVLSSIESEFATSKQGRLFLKETYWNLGSDYSLVFSRGEHDPKTSIEFLVLSRHYYAKTIEMIQIYGVEENSDLAFQQTIPRLIANLEQDIQNYSAILPYTQKIFEAELVLRKKGTKKYQLDQAIAEIEEALHELYSFESHVAILERAEGFYSLGSKTRSIIHYQKAILNYRAYQARVPQANYDERIDLIEKRINKLRDNWDARVNPETQYPSPQ